jgi:hypothetical protein
VVISISAGSRPILPHSSRRMRISSTRLSGRAGKKPSPSRAARFAAPGVWPPTTIGTPGRWRGFGFDSSGAQR